MPDQIPSLLWLPLGGLVAVALVAVAVFKLRRPMSDQMHKRQLTKTAPVLSSVNPVSVAATSTPKSEDVVEMLRAELAAFRAVYQADLSQVLAEQRAQMAAPRPTMPQDAQDLLEKAIELARMGHDAASISGSCDLDPADAAALVRFHGPNRVAVISRRH